MSWSLVKKGSTKEVKEWLASLVDPSLEFFGVQQGFDESKKRHEETFERGRASMLAEIEYEESQPDATGFVTVNFSGSAYTGQHQYSVSLNRYVPSPEELAVPEPEVLGTVGTVDETKPTTEESSSEDTGSDSVGNQDETKPEENSPPDSTEGNTEPETTAKGPIVKVKHVEPTD